MTLIDATPPYAPTTRRLTVTQPTKPTDAQVDITMRNIVHHPTGKVYRWEDDQHTWHVAFELEEQDGY